MPEEAQKRKRFERLQNRYVEQLPIRLTNVRELWDDFLRDQGNREKNLRDLSAVVHSLAGSAGTFHFNELSEVAIRGERLLSKSVGWPLPKEVHEQVENLLERLSVLVERGPETTSFQASEAVDWSQGRPVHPVYVVEDDSTLAEEIVRQLRYFGYRAEHFQDCSSAMDAVDLEIPTALIIDVQLPEGRLAGTEFAQRFQIENEHDVPLIFISIRDDWEARLAAVRGGGESYLVKPIDFSELLERLDLLTNPEERDPYRILIVDDLEVLAEHYSLVMESAGMRAQVLTNPEKLLDSLQSFRPELILMDLHMPACSGVEAASVIRQKDEFTGLPIVYLSTESDPGLQLDAMRVGGDDFLRKPISDRDLLEAVSIRSERFRQIRKLMNRDSLTGLLNHATIKTYLESELERTLRNKSTMCLALVDIDHFKSVNDRFGHLMGDRVLKTTARLFTQRLRKSDLIGRYGGEEFALVFPGTEAETAFSLVDELRQQFSEIIHLHQGTRFSCSFSAGLASVPPGESANRLIQTADEALYAAKQRGRNRVEFSAELGK